ncbi:MAG: OmpA family protein [Crocinitomicaceae bacterium]|nr:OmpA family protein [Crocinitomicaceae bacterium]
MKTFYISLILLVISPLAYSQEQAEACIEPSKKVMKLINAALEAKDAATAVTKFNEAIELDEDNATVYYEYGMYAYYKALEYLEALPNPSKGEKSMIKAEQMLKTALDKCSDYHGNCTYYLGVINWRQNEIPEAVEWFKKFLAFKHDDTERYPENYAKKIETVKTELAKLERDAKIKADEVPYEPSLVRHVSTRDQEYFPMISPDNELIFYTRKLDRKNRGDIYTNLVEEITCSQRPNMLSEFDGGVPLEAPFNDGSVRSYGAATLSVDNKEMILCACKEELVGTTPYMNCDLYSTTFVRSGDGGNDYTWAPLENLGNQINTPNGWEGQPSLSADGKTLFYTVNRPDSRNNDIYIVERKDDGSWGVPRPFDEINTDGKDKSPFLHQDSETLYFVSECTDDRPGVGGLDIFYIRKENGVWTEPKNIGYPINSEADELGLFVSIDGKVAYFSSYVQGLWNIYSFELYAEARPQAVAILKGELTDDNGQPVSDATIEIAYEGSDVVTEVQVNGDNGTYAAIVKVGDDVQVTVKKDGYAFDSKLIAAEELVGEDVAVRGNDLEVKEMKVGEAYTINDILYGTNSSVLSDRSKFILKGFARYLNENPNVIIAIQGHTDDIGDDGRNMRLSEERAQGVKTFLASLGIDKSRLSAKGFGETNPTVPNTSTSNRAQNRRTDFLIEGM